MRPPLERLARFEALRAVHESPATRPTAAASTLILMLEEIFGRTLNGEEQLLAADSARSIVQEAVRAVRDTPAT